jgi:5-formyltetrahydrofolate cyclo-ligase
MPDFASDAERSRSAKIALRDRLLATRRSMAASDRRSASASLQAALLALVRAQQPSTIAAYVPVGPEPGGSDLPSVLASAGHILLLPVLLDSGDLDWAAYEGSLSAGPRGLRQPSGERLGVDAVCEASLVVVPAVAVDRSGVRLGRGGGSYDRVLSRLDRITPTGPMTVALLYDGELVETVPAEPHDRTVRAAITPSGGLTLSRTASR